MDIYIEFTFLIVNLKPLFECYDVKSYELFTFLIVNLKLREIEKYPLLLHSFTFLIVNLKLNLMNLLQMQIILFTFLIVNLKLRSWFRFYKNKCFGFIGYERNFARDQDFNESDNMGWICNVLHKNCSS